MRRNNEERESLRVSLFPHFLYCSATKDSPIMLPIHTLVFLLLLRAGQKCGRGVDTRWLRGRLYDKKGAIVRFTLLLTVSTEGPSFQFLFIPRYHGFRNYFHFLKSEWLYKLHCVVYDRWPRANLWYWTPWRIGHLPQYASLYGTLHAIEFKP